MTFRSIDRKILVGLILSVALVVGLACSSAGEDEAPASSVSPAPTPIDVSAIIQQALQAQPQGASSQEVVAAVQAAMAQQPGVTQAQVAEAIAGALADRPGVTEGQVADAIAKALAERPGVTEGQVADAIASALLQQTPGLTEAQVGEVIAKALADRPGISQADIQAAVAKAVAQPAMAPDDTMVMEQRGNLRVALDIVGTPIYVNRNSPYPVNALPINFGFTEILTGWQENDGVQDCLKPLLAESWEINSDNTKVTINVRKGVMFRAADRNWGEMTAEDVVFSLNDTYIEASRHANNAEMGDVFEWPLVAIDEYTVEGTFKDYRQDFLNYTVMSECSDNASIFAKEVFDEFGLEQATVTPHGTGPFVVQNWLPNERIDAEAVQDHWNVVPSIASLTAIEAKEAAVRSAMLRTNEVDISLVPISDVPKLSDEGFVFHDGLRRFQGHNVVFSGNYWQKTILETGDPVPAREGFTPGSDHPWIGDPWAEGCDIDAMLTPIVPNPEDVCDNMERARKVRWAMALAIDRDAINDTILGGYGGPIYNGRGQNIFHHTNPEWKEKWRVPYDPERAQQLMTEAGYEDGFEWEFYCPAGIGVEEEVCLAVAGMWENTLNLRPKLNTSVYTAKRPTMVQRQINTVWMMNSSATRLSTQEYGVSASYCCLWARPTSGDWNTGVEIDKWYEFDHQRRALDPESEENLRLREEINDFGYYWMMSVGVVEVPGLVGLNPDRVGNWKLRPLRYINSFDTIVLKN